MEKTTTRHINVRLEQDLIDQIEKLAVQEQRTRSNMISYLLTKEVAKRYNFELLQEKSK